MAKPYDYLLKIFLFGDSEVGKTQLLRRFSGGVIGDVGSYTATIG